MPSTLSDVSAYDTSRVAMFIATPSPANACASFVKVARYALFATGSGSDKHALGGFDCCPPKRRGQARSVATNALVHAANSRSISHTASANRP